MKIVGRFPEKDGPLRCDEFAHTLRKEGEVLVIRLDNERHLDFWMEIRIPWQEIDDCPDGIEEELRDAANEFLEGMGTPV